MLGFSLDLGRVTDAVRLFCTSPQRQVRRRREDGARKGVTTVKRRIQPSLADKERREVEKRARERAGGLPWKGWNLIMEIVTDTCRHLSPAPSRTASGSRSSSPPVAFPRCPATAPDMLEYKLVLLTDGTEWSVGDREADNETESEPLIEQRNSGRRQTTVTGSAPGTRARQR